MRTATGKILVVIGVLAVLACGGTIVFGESNMDATPQLPQPELRDPGVEEPTKEREGGIIVGPTTEPESTAEVAGPDVGMISGRIGISTRLIPKLQGGRYRITATEDFNTNGRDAKTPRRFWKTFDFDFKLGTPVFDFDGIPFSKHPYRVSVSAEGVNGSSAVCYVNREFPQGSEEVQLSLMPGSMFTVMLRDQRRNPRTDISVFLVPTGASEVQRPRHHGTTNNFGSVVFQDVLRGEYHVCVGSVGAPMAPPKKTIIYSPMASFANGRPHVQGTTIIVPEGKNVTVEVFSKYGAVLPNATLKAWQLEVKRYYEFKGETNQAGRFVMENVPYGTYQLSIECSHHGRRDQKFFVKNDAAGPLTVKITM